MSVSVLPSRNNNNWVENAVVNFVGPIIGDWIKSERDKEINRKNNAAITQTIQDLMGNNDYHIQPSQNSRLMGGSNNGWQNAFRQSDNNPLAEFDNNTADITPNLAQAAIAPQNRQNIPTAAEFLRNLYSNLGTKRFGMVNSEAVQKLAAPYIAALQADLTKQERQALANKYAKAADLAAKRDVLMGGAIQGHVPYDAPNNVQKWYEFDNPYSIPGSLDAGGEVYPYAFDPRKGSYDFPIQINKSLSPQQVADNAYRDRTFDEGVRRVNIEDARYYAGLDEQGRQFDETMGYNKSNSEWQHGFQERQQTEREKQAEYERNNPPLTAFTGEDGSQYFVNPRTGDVIEAKTPDGKTIKVNTWNSRSRIYQDKDGNYVIIDPTTGRSAPVTASDGSQQSGIPRNTSSKKDLTKGQELEYNKLTKRAQELEKERAKAYNTLSIFAGEPNSPEYKSAQANLQRIENELAKIEEQQRGILGDTSNQPQNSQSVGLTPKLTQEEINNSQSGDVIVGEYKPIREIYVNPDVSQDAKTATRKKGDKVTARLPDEIFYNSERDKDIPEERIMTVKQFREWFGSMLGDPQLQEFTPEQLLQFAINNGIRIRQDSNTTSALPPEETGTSFMGEELPGLQMPGELAASTTPMGLSGGRYSEGTPIEVPNYQEFLPPVNFNPQLPAPPANLSDFNYDNIRNAIKQLNPNNNSLPPDYIPKRNGVPPDFNPNDFRWGPYNPYDDDPYPMIIATEPPIYCDKNGNPAPPEIQRQYLERDGYKFDKNGRAIPKEPYDGIEPLSERDGMINTKRNNRRNNRSVQPPSRRRAINYPTANYNGVIYPKRETRRPGKIKPNTNYKNLKPIVDDAARKNGVDSALVRGIIQIESAWDSNATGPKTKYGHARGLMQLIDSTARGLGVRDPYDVAQNINGGTKYIAQLIRQFNGNVSHALMAYNWGPGNMRKALKGIKRIPSGVRKYARDILAIYNRLKDRRG